MARFGFCAGTYQSTSTNADAQRCWNWYPEIIESGQGASQVALYPSPGLVRFAALTGTHVRGMYEFNGRCFVVSDQLYEVFADGTFTAYGAVVPDDGLPVTMEANSGGQLLICGGGQMWLFPLATGTATITSVQGQIAGHPGPGTDTTLVVNLTSMPFIVGQTVYFTGLTAETWLNGLSATINGISGNTITSRSGTWLFPVPTGRPTWPFGPVASAGTASFLVTTQRVGSGLGPIERIAFSDGYFLALASNSATFYSSAPEDGTTWDPSFSYTVSEFSENVLAMIANFREIWLFGEKRSIIYYDSGNFPTPFQPIPGAFIEHGINARWSVVRLDNGLFWLGSDERGRIVAWRNQGYTPVRISTHGVEAIWQNYPTMSDAIGYSTSKTGHGWWHLYFPSVGHSWRYDTTTGMWHEVAVFLPSGQISAHRSQTHVYAFEKNLVGDRSTGTVYELSQSAVTDDLPDLPQNPIRRARRAPHVINEHDFMFHHKMRLLVETGLGPMPPLVGQQDAVAQLAFLDSNGVYWQANLSDAGQWQTASYATSEELDIALSPPIWLVDLAYLPYQVVVYALGIDTSGNITLTKLGVPEGLSGYVYTLPLQTIPSSLQTELSVSFGILQIAPPQPPPREPQIVLRWSDDGGHTWSNEYSAGAGFAGQFRKRVEWRRLGRSRDRIYEVSTSDSVPWRIVDAYLDVTDPMGQGYKPIQRYAHQVGKML